MNEHPTATPERMLALVIATEGMPQGAGSICLNFSNFTQPDKTAAEHDRYSRLVDTFEAMFWLEDIDQLDLAVFGDKESGSAYEQWTLGQIEVCSPVGCTTLHDRLELGRARDVAERFGMRVVPSEPEPIPLHSARVEERNGHLTLVGGEGPQAA